VVSTWILQGAEVSKRKIVLTIDCNGATCGDCRYSGSLYCELYVKRRETTAMADWARLPECLRAEKEAKR
jgi:hypothetical protein